MQTKIKITEKNLEKIAAFLDSVQGPRAANRLVFVDRFSNGEQIFSRVKTA